MQSRRAFIKNIGLALPAFTLAGSLLTSCGSKKGESPNKRIKIGIIGAGISGLHAAYLLHFDQHYEIEVLEASDRIGGRIQSEKSLFGLCPAEIGASNIYTRGGEWYNAASINGLKRIDGIESTYFIGQSDYNDNEIETDSDYIRMKSTLDKMKHSTSSDDVSIDAFCDMEGVPERVKFILKAQTEQLLGTNIERASLNYSQSEALSRLNTEQYKGANLESVIFDKYKSILPFVSNNIKINSIDYTGDKVVVTDHLQQKYFYDRVIVTVPLSILKIQEGKANHIQFIPKLPNSKIEAMNKLGMDGGYKIFLRLNKRFWKQDTGAVYLDAAISKYDVIFSDDSKQEYVISALVTGKTAESNLGMKNDREIIESIKSDWKQLLGTNYSDIIADHKIVNWSNDSNIGGCFSYHKVGTEYNVRQVLSESINNKLFFAGEACNTENKSGTVEGAIETAIKTVKAIQILA